MLALCNHKRLFPRGAKAYKANLNCHTNISDGEFSPEEVKELYKREGYSIVAFSDREVMIPHKDLADGDFLPLTACEYAVDTEDGKNLHFNVIALDEDNDLQPLWHREKYIYPHSEPSRGLVRFDESEPDYERDSSLNGISDMMQKCRDKGFFVTLNHPTLSGLNYNDYTALSGMDAFEIMNYSSILSGVNEYNENMYSDILRLGKMPFCIAADENKNTQPVGSRRSDSCGAYTVILADSLDYKSIANALKNGHFYSSEGPEIYDVWYRSHVIYVRCSPCDKIIFETAKGRVVRFAEDGVDLTGEGICCLVEPDHKFVRITVVDKYGRKAYTNAYDAADMFYSYEKR